MRRREFIAGLGSTAAWSLAARAQQGDRVRRIGVLFPGEENPFAKTVFSAFTQALAGLGWTAGRAAVTPIGHERSRRSWSACNPTSS
jgi:putative ABC transport system substrate-binding protein